VSRLRDLYPATPSLILYDAGGEQSITSTGEFMTWDNIEYQTSDFLYTEDDDRIKIKINRTGLYQIVFECSFYPSATTGFSNITSQFYLNDSAVDGALSKVTTGLISYYNGQGYDNTAFYISTCITFLIRLEQNDKLQIKCTGTSGTAYTVANSSRLAISYVSGKGWNNRNAGRSSLKGGVLYGF
jgi:hypothetical protein